MIWLDMGIVLNLVTRGKMLKWWRELEMSKIENTNLQNVQENVYLSLIMTLVKSKIWFSHQCCWLSVVIVPLLRIFTSRPGSWYHEMSEKLTHNSLSTSAVHKYLLSTSETLRKLINWAITNSLRGQEIISTKNIPVHFPRLLFTAQHSERVYQNWQASHEGNKKKKTIWNKFFALLWDHT